MNVADRAVTNSVDHLAMFDFVAEVVAFAFGLAAASLFPVILMGIFSKRINKAGAIAV